MKKVVFIHGWDGFPEEGWRPWLRGELEKMGVKIINPAMPNPHTPRQNEWVARLQELIGNPDKNTFLVGHSLGAITILRYLESLHGNQETGGAIFIAGFTDDLGIPELKDFFKEDIKWEEIKKHCPEFISIHSDNDPWVALDYGKIFQKKLNAEEIVEHNMQHFSGDDGITQLPIVLEKLTKLLKN